MPARGSARLRTAANQGSVEELRRLLASGESPVEECDVEGQSALWIASWRGHADCVSLLLAASAPVDRAKSDGATPLFIACQEGHMDSAVHLLSKGAATDAADLEGATPLFIACETGKYDCTALLLSCAASLGLEPVTAACAAGFSLGLRACRCRWRRCRPRQVGWCHATLCELPERLGPVHRTPAGSWGGCEQDAARRRVSAADQLLQRPRGVRLSAALCASGPLGHMAGQRRSAHQAAAGRARGRPYHMRTAAAGRPAAAPVPRATRALRVGPQPPPA